MAGWSIRSSRPTRTSVNSGPTAGEPFSPTRSIRANSRRPDIWSDKACKLSARAKKQPKQKTGGLRRAGGQAAAHRRYDSPAVWPEDSMRRLVVGDDRSQGVLFPERVGAPPSTA